MGSSPSQPSRPGARSHRSVLLGLLVLLALGLGGLIIGYFQLVHYQRAVVYHIPPNTTLAARLDFEQVMLYEPLRKHLFPVFSEASQGELPEALQRFEEKTGVNPGMDLREVLFATGPGPEWALAIGGRFPEAGVVEGLAELLREEGVQQCELQRERLICSAPQLFMQQAPDRVLVLASSEAQLTQALARSEVFKRLGMSATGAGSVVIRQEALAPVLDNPLLQMAPGVRNLQRLERVHAELSLAQNAEVELRLVPGPGVEVSELKRRAEQLLSSLRLLSRLDPSGGVALEQQLLERATISPTADGLVVRSHYTREELDLAARRVARRLSAWLQSDA